MNLANKRILVTGSNGFIGKNLLNRLYAQNVELSVIQKQLKSVPKNNERVFVGDITDKGFVKKVVEEIRPEIVFHLAANKDRFQNISSLNNSIATNLLGSQNIYDSLVNSSSIESIVALGTTDEYGDAETPYLETSIAQPLTAYGFSKLMATKLAEFFNRTANLPITILRPSIAYGPLQGDEMFIPSLINKLLKNEEYLMTPGEQKRDFVFISDLITLMLTVPGHKNSYGKIFNVGFGKSIKLNEVAKTVAKILNKESLLKIGAIEYRFGEQMEYAINNDAVRQNLNWEPKVNLEEGLALTINHYRGLLNAK